MKPIWMWAEDPSDGWAGEHETREGAILEAVACDPDTEEIQLAQVDADVLEEGKLLKFLQGPVTVALTPKVIRRARGLEETRLGQFVPPTELPSEGGSKT